MERLVLKAVGQLKPMLLRVKAGKEPGLGKLEFALDRGAAHTQDLGSFVAGTAQKTAQFDDSCFPFVQRGEIVDGAVELDHLFASRVHPRHFFVQWNLVTVSLGGHGLTGMIDENATDQKRRERVEVAPGREFDTLLAGQPDVQLIHQAGCLESLGSAVAPKKACGDAAQLAVGDRGDFGKSFRVTPAPKLEEPRNITHIRRCARWGPH
jgi:hypothetical protein